MSRGGNKVNSIVHPCFRMVYKLLNDSLFLNGEVGATYLSGIRHFWALCPEGAGTPPWVEIFVTGCIREQRKDRGRITFGGMVTLLANHLGVEFTDDCARLPGGFLYDTGFLQSAHFLSFTTGAYIIKDRNPLPLPPNPGNLFSIPNGVTTQGLRNQVLRGRVVIPNVDGDDDDSSDDEEEEEDEGEEQRDERGEQRTEEGHVPREEGGAGTSEPWRGYIDERVQLVQGALHERWALEDRRWAAQDQRWQAQDERWAVEDERWNLLQQRWSTEDQRWNTIVHHFQGLNIPDPAEAAAREARRRETLQRQSHDHPGTGPGSFDP